MSIFDDTGEHPAAGGARPPAAAGAASPTPAFGPPPPRPHHWFSASLLGILLLSFAVRAFHIEADPPYGLVQQSMTFLTDEGWYTKSSQLHAKFGVWTNPDDLVWYSHNLLYTLIVAAAFDLWGASLEVARLVSVGSFVVAIGAFYGICRAVQPRVIALTTCLLVSMTLHNVAYSRVALVEPVGTAFTLLAMCAWVRMPRGPLGAAATMVLAAGALLVKVSFVYTVIGAAVLCLGDAVVAWRAGTRARGAVIAAVTLALGAAAWGTHKSIVAWAGADGAFFETMHVTSRAKGLQILPAIQNELKMLLKLPYSTGAPTLTCSLGFGLVFLAIKRKLRLRVGGWSRATVACVIVGGAGCGFFGLMAYQPSRYFYFALFPLVFVTVMVCREVVGDRNWRLTALFLLFVHTTVQFPGFHEWLRRSELDTAAASARRVAIKLRTLEPESKEIAVIGGWASYVGLFSPEVRPLDFRARHRLRERLARWRPKYALVLESSLSLFEEKAPGVIAGWDVLDRYRPLSSYFNPNDDQVLVRLRYAD